jgi:hypothetical protein
MEWAQPLIEAYSRFFHEAVDPLHKLTWQTGVFLLGVFALIALIGVWIAKATWWFAKPTFKGVRIRGGSHTYKDHLRLSRRDYLKFHKRDGEANLKAAAVKRDLEKDAGRYYVVTIVESGHRTQIVRREMHLQVTSRRWAVPEGEVQLDDLALNTVRFGNHSEKDDDEGAPIDGTYDVYIRPVRWFDLRHWLTHPNREVRIVIWVTLISIAVPLLKDLLLG